MLSGIFLQKGLDDPNHVDPLGKIGVLAQRPLHVIASAAKQSIARVAETRIASLRSQ
jgi:hypothetical protein